MNSEYTHIKHEFEPVFDKNSKILVLGTLPSVKSRENNFYYGASAEQVLETYCGVM